MACYRERYASTGRASRGGEAASSGIEHGVNAVGSPFMRRVVFDSNAIDPIADAPGALDALQSAVESGALVVLYTHVTTDELSAIPDADRRARLLLVMGALGRIVPTGDFILDVSRLDFARLGDASSAVAIENLRSNSAAHSRDALIASTARYEQCALVTNERRLAARARDEGIEVLTTASLLAEFGFPPS